MGGRAAWALWSPGSHCSCVTGHVQCEWAFPLEDAVAFVTKRRSEQAGLCLEGDREPGKDPLSAPAFPPVPVRPKALSLIPRPLELTKSLPTHGVPCRVGARLVCVSSFSRREMDTQRCPKVSGQSPCQADPWTQNPDGPRMCTHLGLVSKQGQLYWESECLITGTGPTPMGRLVLSRWPGVWEA